MVLSMHEINANAPWLTVDISLRSSTFYAPLIVTKEMQLTDLSSAQRTHSLW